MPLGRTFGRYRYAGAVFALAVVAFAALLFLHGYKNTFLDLRAFYCAGHAFAQGADPYRDAALRPCEMALGTNVFAGSVGFDQPTVPVPWAPYAMPLLALLSAVPFGAAAATWTLLNFAALAIAAELLRRSLPELSPVAIAAFVLFAGVPTEAALGQPAGFELLALVAAGRCLRTRSTAGIAGALAVAALQPYVALPLAIALLWAGAAARRAVAACVAVFAVGSAVFVPRLSYEYLTVIAPEHTRANILEITQLSFTSLFAAFGLPSDPARGLGLLIYVAAIGAGIWAGLRLAAAFRRPEALPWVAAMLATLGAPYLHFGGLACALPGALLVLAAAPAAAPARIGAMLLFVPWIGLLLQTTYSYTIAPFAAAMAWSPQRKDRLARVAAAAFALLCIDLAVSAFFRGHVANPAGYRSAVLPPGALAEDSWRGFIAVQWTAIGTASLAARIVSALGALLLAAAAIAAAARAR
jgi:hypothetical protein